VAAGLSRKMGWLKYVLAGLAALVFLAVALFEYSFQRDQANFKAAKTNARSGASRIPVASRNAASTARIIPGTIPSRHSPLHSGLLPRSTGIGLLQGFPGKGRAAAEAVTSFRFLSQVAANFKYRLLYAKVGRKADALENRVSSNAPGVYHLNDSADKANALLANRSVFAQGTIVTERVQPTPIPRIGMPRQKDE
jgi:hypothetical protein